MNRLQRMLIVCSLASFAAGITVGLAVPVAATTLAEPAAESSEQRYENDYVSRLHAAVALTESQRRLVRAILRDEREQKRRLFETVGQAQQLPRDLQDAWDLAGQQMDKRIQHVLDEKQRAKYRALLPDRAPAPKDGAPARDGQSK